ncbi:MAG TPA: type II secretion system F family protein [Caulobacteraceae bacterium]|jgi:tight adherence protein B|nr:type II secretion system F family protein [Caulobacteraceae bacterium]
MAAYIIPLILVLAFAAVVVLVQGIAGAVFTAGDKAQRVNRRLTMLNAGVDPKTVYSTLVRKQTATGEATNPFKRFVEHVDTLQRQGGLDVSPQRLFIICAAVGAVLWSISLVLLLNSGKQGFLVNAVVSGVAALAISGGGALLWLNMKRTARLKKIEDQLPLALDIVTRAIRAGHPVIAAVQLAANELGDPIGSEFGLIVDETTYGSDFKEALANFAHRTGSEDANFFAVSVSIQSETGGNLAEILESLATVIRSRNTLGKRVIALSSEGRASAYLLSAVPPLVVLMQLLFSPSYYTEKFGDPIFWPVVGIVIVIYFVGWAMIYRILNFRF